MRGAPIYDDLVIRFEAMSGGRDCRAQVVASPCGRSRPVVLSSYLFERCGMLWETLDATIWRGHETAPETARDARAATGTEEAVDPAVLGRKLFDALFADSIREVFLRCFAAVSGQEGRRLRISLELAPEVAGTVASLPWELLHGTGPWAFLGRNSHTPLVRRLETHRLQLTPRPISALRVLAVLSNPETSQRLDVARERQLIEKALGTLPGVDLQLLKKPTIEELRRRLRGDIPFDVLHFAGHGGFDAEGEGFLSFEDDDRQERAVSGPILAENLGGESIRLVFLNACKTARLPRSEQGGDPNAGVASALLMAGVPAVVAMQFPITDRAAACFSGELYSALAQGVPLDSAVVEGRLALRRARPSSWEWATPVLFLGVPDGNLFKIAERGENDDAVESRGGDEASFGQNPVAREQEASALEPALVTLDYQRYVEALAALNRVLETGLDDADGYFYRALARLEGRRPRSARPGVIQQIESDLWQAGQRSRGEEPAHLWLFQALIRHDFYRMNGLKFRPPTIEELLAEARAARTSDPACLKRLLDHAPTPPNPVRRVIEERLARSPGQ